MPPSDTGRSPILSKLAAIVGADRMTPCEGVDADPRTAEHVTGLETGAPLCWVRPLDTAQCAEIIRLAGDEGIRVVPLGEGTTFWTAPDVGDAIAVDTRSLTSTLQVHPAERTLCASAGVTVRAADAAARQHGLCLAAYPDTDGETPLATLLAVGTTAGLGMGRVLPVDQIAGATCVTGRGELLRLGAAHSMGGNGFARQGRPDVSSVLTAAHGRSALITEIWLQLSPAHPLCSHTLRGPAAVVADAGARRRMLEAARGAIDAGVLDSFRLELSADGGGSVNAELFIRTFSSLGVGSATAHAERVADAMKLPGFERASVWQEGDAARAGHEPETSARFSVPPGEHRARIALGAFLGTEVTVGWGVDGRAALERLWQLYERSVRIRPIHRRLGIYPSSHGLSVGVQLLVPRDTRSVDDARALLVEDHLPLLELGAVPYREGELWRDALTRWRARHPEEKTRHDALARVFATLDPEGLLGG